MFGVDNLIIAEFVKDFYTGKRCEALAAFDHVLHKSASSDLTSTTDKMF